MTEIRVPTLGESVTEATIGRWFKQAGEAVAVDEPLVELETDKVTIEVPAPAAGVLAEIAAKDGETVEVGALLGQIKEGAGAAPSAPRAAPKPAPTSRPDQKTETTQLIDAGREQPAPKSAAPVASKSAPAARADAPQPRHLHALFARRIVGGRRRAHLDRGSGVRHGRRLRCGALDRRQHVALGDAAILAGAGNGGGVDAALGGEFAHRRRQRRV